MLLRSYYHLKPLLPRRFQIAVRRILMKRRLAKVRALWPIDPKAAQTPEGWRGWPEGKQFALVLTHDVEGERGYARCLALAGLEERLGFRSSFNFVAEGYPVSGELRRELTSRGFEVGVHGITHDGHLYRSRRAFLHQASKINRYLREWEAVGFRSPAMHRNLEWIADLDIDYDASTFDTDPFEPQPEGVGTIFPFLLSGNGSTRGYVELPYTLPQDFTLFVLLQQRSIEIWERKLDWIAEHGGMALFLTHPDFMSFDKTRTGFEEYPSEFYADVLGHVKDRYGGRYWSALPREMARYWSACYGV